MFTINANCSPILNQPKAVHVLINCTELMCAGEVWSWQTNLTPTHTHFMITPFSLKLYSVRLEKHQVSSFQTLIVNKYIINCYPCVIHYAHSIMHWSSRSIINMVSDIKSLSDIQRNGTEDAVAKWGYITGYQLVCSSCWNQGGIRGEGVAAAALTRGSALSFPVQDVT